MTIVEPESRGINENGPIISVTAAEEVLHLVVGGGGGGGKEKNPIIQVTAAKEVHLNVVVEVVVVMLKGPNYCPHVVTHLLGSGGRGGKERRRIQNEQKREYRPTAHLDCI